MIAPSGAQVLEELPSSGKYFMVYRMRIGDVWVALKRIRREHRNNPLVVASLEREFRIGFGLDHPNIIKYLNTGTDNDGPFTISEYVDGITLKEMIGKSPGGITDLKLVGKIATQLLDALGYLHQRQTYHLDLKPGNLMVTHKGGNLKVIDLGMCSTDSILPLGAGTEGYSAPEQAVDPKAADARSDIYAFGMILLETLTGSADLSHIGKVPARFRSVVARCIEPKMDRRYYSVAEVQAGLAAKKRMKPILIGVFALLLAMVAVVSTSRYWMPLFNGNDYNNTSNIIEKNDASSPNQGQAKTSKEKIASVGGTQNDPVNKSSREIFNNVTAQDSMACVGIGDGLYNEFIKAMIAYEERPGSRPKKLALIEIKGRCVDQARGRIASILSGYDKGTLAFSRLIDIYTLHASQSESRIDSIIRIY